MVGVAEKVEPIQQSSEGRPCDADERGESSGPDPTVLTLGLELDSTLRFRPGVLELTDHRLRIQFEGTPPEDWPLSATDRLLCQDVNGLGRLELIGPDPFKRPGSAPGRRVAAYFRLKDLPQAMHLVRVWEQRCLSGSPVVPPAELGVEVVPAEPAEDGEESSEQPSPWTLLKLWRFALPYRRMLLQGFGLTLAATAATLVPPYLTLPLMDDVLIPFQNGQPLNTDLAPWLLVGLFASALLAWGLGWARTYLLALVSERIGADLRTAAYEHLLRLPLDYFGSRRTGDLMSRIGSESDRICVFLSLHLLDFATDLLMILMTAAILFTIDPWLAVVTLLPLPLILRLIMVVRDRLRTGFEKIDRIWAEVTSVLADTIPGIRVVKAFAQERRESDRFRAANAQNLAINDRVNKVWAIFGPSVTFLTEMGLLVVWAFGIWLVTQNQITVGVLTAFLAYIGRFYTRLDAMSRIVSHTQRAATAAKRLFDILDHQSSVPEHPKPVRLPELRGALELRNVGFRYGSRPVLKDLSLQIRPGEMVGVVGHSGSGKSTLVNLICRFYDVSEGAILVDGHDLRQVSLSDYRSHIGLVLQEPFLFFGTIADNIAYGKPGATRAEVVAAARAAHAHEFILRLPFGYDSLVGERGQALSGGERQRISIARALLINPRILILDEATSAVDSTTEKEIQKALDNLVAGRTTLAIAHRLSTLRKADRLVVLDRGVMVEQGSHDVLMARGGAYKALVDHQARLEATHAA